MQPLVLRRWLLDSLMQDGVTEEIDTLFKINETAFLLLEPPPMQPRPPPMQPRPPGLFILTPPPAETLLTASSLFHTLPLAVHLLPDSKVYRANTKCHHRGAEAGSE